MYCQSMMGGITWQQYNICRHIQVALCICGTHGLVVIGVRPKTQSSIVQAPLWSLDVVPLDKALNLHCLSSPS